jgi:hypothetical protein
VIAAADIAAERALVASEACSWIGTPFHHAARIKGAGVDCAQLLLAVYCGLGLVEEPAIDRYSADWFLHQDRERILEILEAPTVPTDTPDIGDIALFRYGRSVSHSAIVVQYDPGASVVALVHSHRATGVVLGSECPSRFAGYRTLRRWTGELAPIDAQITPMEDELQAAILTMTTNHTGP